MSDRDNELQTTGTEEAGAVATPPPTKSGWIELAPVRPGDYPFLYEMAVSPSHSYRWRFRSTSVSFEDFTRTISQGVLVQFMILSVDGTRRLGLATCYQADFRNRHAYIAVQASPEITGSGWVPHAVELFINYLFSCYDFHKLYAESPEFVVDRFKSAIGQDFVEEACFRDHERFFGRAWNGYVFAYYRSTWIQRRQSGKAWTSRKRRDLAGDHQPVLSFDDFVTYLEDELSFDRGSLTPETLFHEDQGLDSIGMLELLYLIEDLGVILDEEALTNLQTVDDAYFHYIQRTDTPKTDR